MQISHGFAIDPEITSKAEFLIDDFKEPYTCTLNQADLKKNSNKFYILQALLINGKPFLFTRYGRVGEHGISTQKEFQDANGAIRTFKAQFKSKTKNNWADRADFILHPEKYLLMANEKIIPTAVSEQKIAKPPLIKLDLADEVISLLRLFTDREMLRTSMAKMDIDLSKLPLGKISPAQLAKAKKLLLEVPILKATEEEIIKMSSIYYTLIPFPSGRSAPPLLNSSEKIARALDHLDDLENISINIDMQESDDNSFDTVYKSLGTKITLLSKDNQWWSEIEKYLLNSHGPTHHFRLRLLNIFEIERFESNKNYQKAKNIGNRELLIHGSRMCNWVSILSKGLLLDPQRVGAIITGKMFGYGIYFANSFSKSAQYCGHSGIRGKKEIVCFTLAEVALGNEYKTVAAEPGLSHNNLRSRGYDSTWGLGRSTPSCTTVIDDVSIPNGDLKRSIEKNASLFYDEKIVYQENQFNFRFLVLAEMDY